MSLPGARELAPPLHLEPMPRQDLSVVLLAGGRNRRMGRTKAFLRVPGGTVISRLLTVSRELSDCVVISANEREPFEPLGVPVIPDLFPGAGPMAGIHAALSAVPRPHLLAIATDMPRVSAPTLELIVSFKDSYDVVLPKTADGLFHPLCAVYSHSLLPALGERLAAGKNRLLDLVFDSRFLAVSSGFNELDLANWNTPEDLQS